MFIPLKIILIGIDPYAYIDKYGKIGQGMENMRNIWENRAIQYGKHMGKICGKNME